MHPLSFVSSVSRRIWRFAGVFFSMGATSLPAGLRIGGFFFLAPGFGQPSDGGCKNVDGSRGVCHAPIFFATSDNHR